MTMDSSNQDGRVFGSYPRARYLHLVRLLAPIVGIFLCLALGASAAGAAQYTVNSTGDQVDVSVGSEGCKTALGTCTLRAAIEESNGSVGAKDTIKFTGSFDGQVGDTIDLATSLPTITDQVDLEGNPKPQECETDYFSVSGPCVGIDGPTGETAFRVAAERVLLIGFAISGAKTGVEVVGAPGLEVWKDWFGLKLDGSAGPLETGISVDQNSNGPLIGLSTNAGNIFAHNTNAGLEINGGDYATVHGNGFGILPDGTSLAANGTSIKIADAASGQNRVARGNEIGGTFAFEDPASTICDVWCNVISGATEAGIDLAGDGPNQEAASGSTKILDNYIGLNAFGTTGVPNIQQAIRVGTAANVTIGGPREIERNLINGGISGVLVQPYAPNLVVENNWIGLDATGGKMLAPPSSAGIRIEDGSQIRILGNRISMTSGTAIEQSAPEVVIRGNKIGQGAGGQDLPGGTVGIKLDGDCGFCNLVEGNVVANASENGLLIEGDKNQIVGNRVEGAGAAGILISAASFNGVSGNVIGADAAEEENTISGNGGAAIEIREEAPFGEAFGNFVGRNNGTMNGAPFLFLPGGTNRGILPPAFSLAAQDGAQGQSAEPGAMIRVFRKADASAGEIGSFLAETVADEDGDWAVVYPSSIPGGTIVAASQTDSKKGTSEFVFSTTVASAGKEGKGDGDSEQAKGNPPAKAPDTTAPETRIVGGPKSRSRSRSARFQFTSSEPAGFRCKLDRQAESNCRSPRVYRQLRTGRHVFRVWAIDDAGNRDASPARWVFRIDSR